MLPKTLMCGVVCTFGFLAAAGLRHPDGGCPGARIVPLACASASAGEKEKEKPVLSGVWVQNGGEMRIQFAEKRVVKFFPHGDDTCIVVCQYTLEKKGQVNAKITELEGKFKQKLEKALPVGTEFRFTWTVKDDTGMLEDVQGEKVERSHLEGKYRLQK